MVPIWSRFTSGSVASAALARTKNGVLHIVFRDGAQVKHTTVDAAGKPAGASTVVAAAAESPGPWLIAAPDGALLTAVLASGGSLHTAASKDAGATWNASAPLATTVAAAVVGGKDGKPLLLLAGSGGLQLQEPPAAPETVYESASCCGDGQRAALALDAESAEGWAAWPEKSAQLAGVMAKAVKPSTGKALPAPGARFDASSPLSLSARLGAPGVYLAYATGNRQASQIKLWNVRGGEALTIARAPAGASHVCLVPAPDGRFWVMWRNPGAGAAVSAVRSDKSLLRFSRPYTLAGVPGGSTITQLAGNAAAGPLDVLANAFHARIYPSLEIEAASEGIRVSDLGEPVKGAYVEVEGKVLDEDRRKRLGRLPDMPPGARLLVKASLPGYAPSSATVVGRAK